MNLADIVKEGKSLAIHTSYAKTLHNQRNPITQAKEKMLPIEYKQYKAWVGGAIMPTIDWKNSRKTVELPQNEKSHFKKQVRVIREIYDNPHITRTDACWFMSKFGYMIPPIEAVVMVRTAQRKYVSDREGLTEMELAELETARNIVQVTMDILEKRSVG